VDAVSPSGSAAERGGGEVVCVLSPAVVDSCPGEIVERRDRGLPAQKGKAHEQGLRPARPLTKSSAFCRNWPIRIVYAICAAPFLRRRESAAEGKMQSDNSAGDVFARLHLPCYDVRWPDHLEPAMEGAIEQQKLLSHFP
jgi:hypothetical protein